MARAPSGGGRDLRIPTLTSAALPQVVAARAEPARIPGGAGSAEFGLAARIDALNRGRQAREDRAAESAATDAGLAAGAAEPGTMMDGGGQIYRDAFNRAAVEGASRRLEIQMRDRMDALATEHEGNPESFSRAAAAFRDGMAEGLPDPVRTRFALAYDTLARPYFNQLQERQRRQVADQAIASFNEALPRRIAAIDRLARRSLADPSAAAAVQQEERDALADLVAMGPRAAFTIDGRDYPADPTRAGALTVTQLVEQQRRIRDAGIIATALGAFEQGPQTEAWIETWTRRELSEQGAGLAPDLVRRIERDMRAQLADVTAARRESQGRAWAGLQERVAAVRAGLALTGQEGDRITDEELLAAGRTPEQVAAWRREVTFSQHAFAVRRELGMAGAEKLDEIQQRLLPGGDLFRLDPQGALRLAETLAQRREGAAREGLQQRIRDARTAAEAGTGLAPRYATRLPEAWRPIVASAAQQHGVPEALARELLGLESSGSATITSPRGAVGAAQIMEETARRPGFGLPPLDPADRTDPAKAIPWGLRYLARMRQEFGSWRLALAAYNAGPERVRQSLEPGGRALPAETLRYVAALLPYAGDQAAPATAARVTPQEGAAAGLTGNQVEQANRELQLAEERGRLRRLGATGAPEDVAQARAALPIEGEDAAENALRFQALEEGLRRRLAAAEQPADYVQAEFPVVAEQWARALQEPGRTGAAIQATMDAQEQLGIPSAQRQPVPRQVAQQLVAQVQQLPTAGERLQSLDAMLRSVPDPAPRQQLLAGMRSAGLPENLAVAAAVQARAGATVGARIASELAVDVQKLGLQPTERRGITDTVAGVFDADDRLGGLRRAQYEATRSAEFLQLGEQEQQLLARVGLVRGAPSASLSGSEARQAYADLFGGRLVVARPRAGVLVSAPAGTDAERLATGLQAIARERILALVGDRPELAPLREQLLRETIWTDAGARDFALYVRGLALPQPGADGRPIRVTLEEALAARPAQQAAAGATAEEQRRRADAAAGAPLARIGGPPQPGARREPAP